MRTHKRNIKITTPSDSVTPFSEIPTDEPFVYHGEVFLKGFNHTAYLLSRVTEQRVLGPDTLVYPVSLDINTTFIK